MIEFLAESDFFVKISERKQKTQQDPFSVVSHEGNGLSCLSPNSTPGMFLYTMILFSLFWINKSSTLGGNFKSFSKK